MKEPKSKTNPPTLSFAAPKIDDGSEENQTTLVNENQSREHQGEEEYVTDVNTPPAEENREQDLAAVIVKLEQELGQAKIKSNELAAKLAEVNKQKSNYSDVSRKFRIFLSLCEGFASRGTFDQSELVKKPGSEHNLFRHIAGLTEVAQKATENRF